MPEGITLDEWQAEMERVLEAEAAANQPPRQFWTVQEKALLAKFYGKVQSRRLAELLGRSIAGITMQASRMDLTTPHSNNTERGTS